MIAFECKMYFCIYCIYPIQWDHLQIIEYKENGRQYFKNPILYYMHLRIYQRELL